MVSETDSHTEDKPHQRITRRGLVRGGTIVAGVSLISGVGLWHSSQPVLAVEIGEENWEADDTSITTHDGSITEVNVKPTIAVIWEGFNSSETDLHIEIDVDFPEAEEEDGGLLGGALGLLVEDTDDLPVNVYMRRDRSRERTITKRSPSRRRTSLMRKRSTRRDSRRKTVRRTKRSLNSFSLLLPIRMT